MLRRTASDQSSWKLQWNTGTGDKIINYLHAGVFQGVFLRATPTRMLYTRKLASDTRTVQHGDGHEYFRFLLFSSFLLKRFAAAAAASHPSSF
jgi:hypothetical protein